MSPHSSRPSSEHLELVLERMHFDPPLSWDEPGKQENTNQKRRAHERVPGFLADPINLHSFAKDFSLTSLIRIRKCAACQSRFITTSTEATYGIRNFLEYASGKDNELLRCLACGIYAHRTCAFHKIRNLEICKTHQLALDKRIQAQINSNRSDFSQTQDECVDCTTTTEANEELIVQCTSSGQPDEPTPAVTAADIPDLISEDDMVWSCQGPPRHWAHTTPSSLWGIKRNNRITRDNLVALENGLNDISTTIADEKHFITDGQQPIGQSFMRVSNVLQDVLFRYFTRPSSDGNMEENKFELNKSTKNESITDMDLNKEENKCTLNESGNNESIGDMETPIESNTETKTNEVSCDTNNRSIILSAANDGQCLSTVSDSINLLEAPNKSNSFLENTIKGVTTIDTITKRGIQLASAAGSFAGGLAGLLLAGPTGMYIGSRIGTVACVASVVGGPIGVGILVVGVAGSLLSAKNTKADEKRLITLGDGGGKLMMVRSNIVIDPIWEEILVSARKSAPSTGILPGLTSNAEKRRKLRDFNIVSSDESELTFSNKVFLLVSSSLNDKKSHPGHVYRCLMKEYRTRALKHVQDRTRVPSFHDKNSEVIRAIRQDTHAVIKFVTMVLIESRPGLATSPRIQEMTASTVESLVFGEVYDLVLQEIIDETRDIDNNLMLKISDFQVSARSDFEEFVSEKALCSLRLLPDARSVWEKLNSIVRFLEEISYYFSVCKKYNRAICADNLLESVCHHIIVAKVPNLNAEIGFILEFANDDQLLRGKEGYALVTFQASLHFMNACLNFDTLFDGLGGES